MVQRRWVGLAFNLDGLCLVLVLLLLDFIEPVETLERDYYYCYVVKTSFDGTRFQDCICHLASDLVDCRGLGRLVCLLIVLLFQGLRHG